MKLTLISLFAVLSFSAFGQNIDTIRVRNLTLQAQDWAWLVGKNSGQINKDSTTIDAFRRIRTAVKAVSNPQWTTNINIDSIPGSVVVAFYQTAKSANSGEIVSRYTAITNAIAAKTVISYWIGFIDASVSGDFNRFRDLGKNIILD